MQQGQIPGIIDPKEAPDGYYAVPKERQTDGGNICRGCDWRTECQKPDTDFTMHNRRCMSYPIASAIDGREIKRNDECSVMFKRADHFRDAAKMMPHNA